MSRGDWIPALWMLTIVMGIGCMVSGILTLSSFAERVVTRVASPGHVNDSSYLISLGTGAISYRICNGTVPHTCLTCDDGSYSSVPDGSAAAGAFSPSASIVQRSARSLAEGDAVPRKHPDDICTDLGDCGAQLHFDDCPLFNTLIERCDALKQIAKPLASYTVVAASFGIFSFVLAMVLPFMLDCQDSLLPQGLGGGIFVTGLMVVIFSALALQKQDAFMSCTDCCKDAVVSETMDLESDRIATSSLSERSFSFEATTRNGYIVGLAFGSAYLVMGLVQIFLYSSYCKDDYDFSPPPPDDAAPASDDDDQRGNNAANEMIAVEGAVVPDADAGQQYEPNHPYCDGQHQPFGYGNMTNCGNAACQIGRRVCVASCEGCPCGGGDGSAQVVLNHPQCRGGHCRNFTCMSRPSRICVSTCTMCPE